MLDDVLAEKVDEPDIDLENNEETSIVTRLVELDDTDQ